MRVLVVSGASGGHIFPALSLIDALKTKEEQAEIILILPRNIFIDSSQLAAYKVKRLSISSIGARPNFKNLKAAFNFLKGSLESVFLLLEFRPDVVVGFGSIISIPLLLCAWIFRIKILIHEQNVVPGRANRLLSIVADSIAVSFQESRKYFHSPAKNILLSGNPVRKGLRKIDKGLARDYFSLAKDKTTVLVAGGSQGSHRLNSIFLEAASRLSRGPAIQVIHLAGTKDRDFIEKSYAGLNITARVFAFLKEIEYAYSASDILFSRSGAATISEMIFFGIPGILVPYPFAYAHQASNAAFLRDRGCADIVNDNELYADKLAESLHNLINNTDKIKNMGYNYNNIRQLDSAAILANAAISLEHEK